LKNLSPYPNFFFPRIFLLSSVFIGGLAASALAGGPGTTGAVELKIPVGPRAIAMGQAFVAVADDANAVYWNPAGLNQLGGTHLTAQYDVYIETVRYNYFAAATKLGSNAALGLGVKLLSTGTEPAVDASGNQTAGTVGENYMDVDLAGAYRLSYYFDLGLTVKYISKSLSGPSAAGFAADLGMLYRTPVPHLTAGLNLQNMGPGLKFEQIADPLPFNVKVGLAYKMFEDNFTVAYDMNFPIDNAASAALGGEYWYKDTLVGRFGYQFQGSIDQNQVGIGGKAGLYLGAGVKIAAFKDFIGLDYAWTDDGFLGSNHHFALDFYF
jgi:long-subunit fatty acid transport protein